VYSLLKRVVFKGLVPLAIDSSWSILHSRVDERDTIAIFGTSRSGTTWIMEFLMNVFRDYNPIFEPLFRYAPLVRKLWRRAFQRYVFPPDRPYIYYLRENEVLYRYLSRVFCGRVVEFFFPTPVSLYREKFRRLYSDKVLVKFIRANRLLPWILYRFQLRGAILVIRHPCATILSQLRVGWYPKTPHAIRIMKRNILLQVLDVVELDGKERLLNIIRDFRRPEEILAASWALDYYIPLYYQKCSWYNAYILPYESLLVNSEEELKSLFNFLGAPLPENIFDFLYKPSSMASKPVKRIDPNRQLVKWMNQLTEKQVNVILKTINYFGINFYDESPEPDYDAIKNFGFK